MTKFNDIISWEDSLLALPLAGKVSGEHEEHSCDDAEFVRSPTTWQVSLSAIVSIIRIKRRRAFRFPATNCPECGELFISAFWDKCEKCR